MLMRKITEILVTHKRGRPNYGSQGAEVRCTVENPDDSLDIERTIIEVTQKIENAWERKVDPPKEVMGIAEAPRAESQAPAIRKKGRPVKAKPEVVPAVEESKETSSTAVKKPKLETASEERAAKVSEDASAAFFDEEPFEEQEPVPAGERVKDAFNWDE